ncbi:hypothetical protein ABPG74_010242 [Tetrahymena malaccensis]
MRNILLSDYYKFNIEELADIEAFDFEEFSYTLYIITKSKILYAIKIESLESHEIIFKADLSNDICDVEKVLGIKYILELESVIIIQQSGEIMKFSISDKSCESVGCIENGILGFSYSPNQEQLIVATGNHTLLSFDNNFDVSKEVHIDEDVNSFKAPSSPQPVYFAWKADAKFFACNFAVQGGRKSLTRSTELEVFKSAAQPDPDGQNVVSVSEEPTENLQGPISWQPTGNFIAGVDKKPSRQDKTKTLTRVIFWEKNGLRHLEFNLPNLKDSLNTDSNSIEVINLQYNKESEILAVHVREGESQESILLYHRSNYRWYLKKVVQCLDGIKINGLIWCLQNSKRLVIVYEQNFIEVLDLSLVHSQNIHDTVHENNLSLIPSVDNNKILTTVFKKTIMPPPMSNFELALPNPVLGFSAGNNYICAACDNSFEIFTVDNSLGLKQKTIKNEVSKQSNRLRQFLMVPYEDKYSIFFVHNKGESKYIVEIVLDSNMNVINTFEKSIKNSLTASCASGYLYTQTTKGGQKSDDNGDDEEEEYGFQDKSSGNYLFIQNSKGTVFKYFLNDDSKIEKHSTFEIPASKIQATVLNGMEYLFGLSHNYRFMLGSKIISSQATSFALYDSFVLFTQNTLGMYQCMYVYDLSDPKNPLAGLSDSVILPTPESKSLNVRNIERGSIIVSVANDKLVFQLPRGNLETINHRIIFLRKVKKLIDQDQYNTAFELCRTNKLDINVIFDINPKKFTENAQSILTKFKKTDYINLLIAQVKNELSDEIQYCVYDEELQELKNYHTTHLSKKINTFCDSIIKALEATKNEKYLYSQFTAHIRKEPSELEFVLNTIKQMKDEEAEHIPENHPPHLNPANNKRFEHKKHVTARSLLEYVCWLADAEKIYEVSLGTYDLDLVAMAAQFTQKDPKEYVPYLEKLKAMTDLVERKYLINMDLKKYDRAVVVLSQGNAEQKKRAITLIKQHNLFNVGLKTFKSEPLIIREVKVYMGEYLASKKEFQQALLAFESVHAFEEALSVCKKSGEVKRALYYANKLKKTEEEKQAILKEILHELLLNENHSQAGKVYHQLGDNKTALEHFVKGSDWAACTKTLLKMEEDHDVIKAEIIVPGLELASNLKANLLRQYRQTFSSKYARLKVVQQEKKMRPQLLGELGAGQFGNQEADMISDISESTQKTTTTHTSYTFSITTGMRKKKDKKPKNLLKRNIKEGSPIEEEYIVDFLTEMQGQMGIFTDCKNLIQYLIYYDMIDAAEELNKEMKLYEEEINIKVKSLKQSLFEEQNPQLAELYPNIKQFDNKVSKAFDVFLNNFDHVLV